jgi:riboflavin transporter FmnP
LSSYSLIVAGKKELSAQPEGKKVNTKTVTVIIVFAALAIVLNLSPLKIPAPYAPYLIYQIWEIPIVAAFLLYGTRVSVLIALLNTLTLIALFPGSLPTGPLYNLAAILGMLFGIGLMNVLVKKRSLKQEAIVATLFTASGVVSRTALMAFVNYVCLRFPPPVGYGLPEEGVVAAIPFVIIFNLTLALYTIPLGYSVTKAVKSYTKV